MSRPVDSEPSPVALPASILPWAGLVCVELSLLVVYFTVTTATAEGVRYLLYPFVWINAGLWAVSKTTPMPGNRRHRLFGLIVAGGYLLLLATLSGTVGVGGSGSSIAVRIGWYAPGWGPLFAVEGSLFRLYLVPFEVVGYVSLAYLVYAATLSATRGAFVGTLGLVTCVGCTVPVLAPAVGLLGGPASALTTTAYRWSYDLGTLLYLLTLGLLYASHRRPSAGR